MHTHKLEVGKKPKIEISSIGGDLRLSGREDTRFEAKVPRDERLQIEQKGNVLRFKCPTDCLIFLPRESIIEIETVGGDLRAINIMGELMVREIGGDLSMRGIGEVTIETVGGDFSARRGTRAVGRVWPSGRPHPRLAISAGYQSYLGNAAGS